MLKRYLVFFLGLAILALGVAFSIKADLGTSPISSLPYAASEVWPVSVGVATILMHVVFILMSKFRSRFKLSEVDRKYIAEKGLETIRRHDGDFVLQKLAPAQPPNDGKQTPMRIAAEKATLLRAERSEGIAEGEVRVPRHPVFKAQHATATCCRACMNKWECQQALNFQPNVN